MFEDGESTEYAGKAVVALASDPKVFAKTGRILITGDLGREYGFVDIDGKEIIDFSQLFCLSGRSPPTMRSVNTMLKYFGYKRAASFVPQCVRLPGWLLTAIQSKL